MVRMLNCELTYILANALSKAVLWYIVQSSGIKYIILAIMIIANIMYFI